MFVLDCSVTMAWAFDDEDVPRAAGMRDRLGEDLAVVPAIWALEVGNALLVAERRQRISRAEAVRFVEILRALPIDVDATPALGTLSSLLSLARQTGVSVYDAGYLDLAAAHGLPLATLDKVLERAARQIGVALLE
jgi:predicted nucleic acid-binding protein